MKVIAGHLNRDHFTEESFQRLTQFWSNEGSGAPLSFDLGAAELGKFEAIDCSAEYFGELATRFRNMPIDITMVSNDYREMVGFARQLAQDFGADVHATMNGLGVRVGSEDSVSSIIAQYNDLLELVRQPDETFFGDYSAHAKLNIDAATSLLAVAQLEQKTVNILLRNERVAISPAWSLENLRIVLGITDTPYLEGFLFQIKGSM